MTLLPKRHKNDEADAEAISEATSRATMRSVAVKTEEQQAQGMLYRTRGQRLPLQIKARGCRRRSANWTVFCPPRLPVSK